jgi:23S rRNA (guanosine2251-2'-O)-methyltransferase
VASISPISFFDLETLIDGWEWKTPLFLVLDQISDARNFGAIIRTAECTGVNGIIVQKAGSAPVNGDTVKRQQEYLIFPFVKLSILKMRSSFYRQVELKLLLRPKDRYHYLWYFLKRARSNNNGIRRPWCKPFCFEDCWWKAKLPMFGSIGSLMFQ